LTATSGSTPVNNRLQLASAAADTEQVGGGGGAGKVGRLPLNFQLVAYYHVVTPENAADCQLRFRYPFPFPKQACSQPQT
jgi:hypothetical protein